MMPPLPGPQGPPGIPPQVAQLAAMIGGGGGGPPPPDQGPPPGDTGGGGNDPFALMQQWLNDTHALIASLPDPQDTQIMSQCLAQGAKIQAKMMQAQQGLGSAQQDLAQRLGSASPAY